jgi:hypothetical protein
MAYGKWRGIIVMEHIFVSQNGHQFLTFPEFIKAGLSICMTTGDMDVGTSTNGDIESIRNNLKGAFNVLGSEPELMYNGYQEHTDNLEIINSLDQGLVTPYGRYIPSTDGLITDMTKVCLLTRFADCVPIVLFDIKNKVHANIHSGWKGTLLNIGEKGVHAMKRNFNSKGEDIIALIGPCIGRDDFEVEWDVASRFIDIHGHIPEAVRKKNERKFLVDLQLINRELLLNAGIKEHNINIIPISTFSDNRFHSYRRDKASYGLMGMLTMIK